MKDIEIARSIIPEKINTIAENFGIPDEYIENYGKYKAKVSNEITEKIKNNPNGKLILVTAINPTPLGEGKTTVSIGLHDALRKINKKSLAVLREPSLRSSIRNERRSNRRRICTNNSNGRHKPSLHRRLARNNISE